MRTKDQMGNWVNFNFPPKRIISLVPSQSELIWDLGLKEELIGVTKFCVHPLEMFKKLPKVGGTKKIDIKKIIALNPDLVIGNKEENDREQIKELMKLCPVWMSDISTLADALQMIKAIGKLTDRKFECNIISKKIANKFSNFKKTIIVRNNKLIVAYLIWKNPYMVAGDKTFINDLLICCGFKNAFSESRYPTISLQQLQVKKPDFIFLSSEPFPFKEKHIIEFQKISPSSQIKIVDGEMFSWYGSRLSKSIDYFNELVKSINKMP